MKKKNSRDSYLSIRQKLIAAVAMLLVATFMVASSSYAWFTLSTAPEVTGIKTSVGANGSLEIALMPVSGNFSDITTGVGTSGTNESWGNLVDLTDPDNKYGLEDITLYPSVIIVNDLGEGKSAVDQDNNILGTPVYGADGRIKTLNANGTSGLYSSTGKFEMNTDAKGVTAIGTVSSMSQQQIDWMNAKSKANAALNSAKRITENALSNNGAALVNLILTNVGGATEYDMAAVGGLITALAGTPASGEGENAVAAVPGVASYLEEAMAYYIVAVAAYLNPNMEDTEFAALKNAIIADCTDGTFPEITADKKITIENVGTIDLTGVSQATALITVYGNYDTIKTNIGTAQDEYNDATYDAQSQTRVTTGKTWAQVHAALSPLMNVDNVKINGHPKSDFTGEGADLGALAGEIITDRAVVIEMPSGSGVFADIGKVCENITATFECDVDISEPFAITVPNMPINMKTTVDPAELVILTDASNFPDKPAGRTSTTTQNLTSLYGYSLDFAFRTNAVSSKLMLQTTGVNRIYSSGGSEETMGHGSSMTFNVTDNKFTVTSITNLIRHVRIVFTDAEGNVIATAKLDTAAATVAGDSVTAPIKLCQNEIRTITTSSESGAASISTLRFGDFIEPSQKGQTEIMDLAQNTATMLSVYVYLDGEAVTSGDVAPDTEVSTSGTMNLQFSSDANLVPMDYAPLKDQSNTATETTAP